MLGAATVVPNDKYFDIQKNLDIFVTMFKEVNAFYVDDIDPEELIETGINSMLATLDPYTIYIPEDQSEEYRFMTTNEYGGIGTNIARIGTRVLIATPRVGFPAQKAGLLKGDEIISVNGKSIDKLSTQQVSAMLKGKPGTDLTMKVKRGDRELEVSLTRERITIDNVAYSGLVGDDVGYIRLVDFTTNTTSEVRRSIESLKELGATSFILDLRGNPGGLLNEAINTSNLFVDKGQEVVSTRGRSKEWDKTYKALNEPFDTTSPLAVLVNNNSASAAEIVAGVMQDYDRAVLVGRRTFGKGLVQGTRSLSYDAQLKITTAKYYIPSGRCIQAIDYANNHGEEVPDSLKVEYKTKNGRSVFDGAGISPDIEVEPVTIAPITRALIMKGLLFDYSTVYHSRHSSIDGPESFQLSDRDYSDFENWLKTQDYSYENELEIYISELEKSARAEDLYDMIEEDISKLKDRVQKEKENDIEEFKPEISKLLEEQIIGHYYSEKGAIMASLRGDQDLAAAIDILHDRESYKKILEGKNN